MKAAVLLLMLGLFSSCESAYAQWPGFAAPNVPRLNDGKPDLSATAPKSPDGKPDLCLANSCSCRHRCLIKPTTM
jgi:hypothetical protein